MTLCAAVPCYNGAATLADTLDALLVQTRAPNEIVVVDDGSRDSSAAIAARYPVRILRHASNAGLSAARNTALTSTNCSIILYVDADARADSSLVATILAGFSDDSILGVGGQGIEVNTGSLADRWRSLHATQSHGTRQISDCDFLFGLCMAYRREALLAVGGFSPLFRTNGEDMDIGFRLRAAMGGRLLYTPAAKVFHQRRDDEISLLRAMRAWYYWAYVAKAIHQRRPSTLWLGTLRRSLTVPLSDLALRRDAHLARLGLRVAAAKFAGLHAAASDYRVGDPGRAWREAAKKPG